MGLEARKRILTLQEVQTQFGGHVPGALVKAYRLLAEAQGAKVNDAGQESPRDRRTRMTQERDLVEAAEIVFIWSNFSSESQTEH
jgi:hypothetical protein